MEGVDYAWNRPNLDQLLTAGKRFVSRYLAYNGTNGYALNGKVLTSAERQALHAKGFAIMLNWEQAAGDMLKGYDTGKAHAQEALRQANALGAPASVPIYFSCDVDVTSDTQMASAGRYLDGVASVLGANRLRVGVYGEADVIDAMVPARAAWGWQTYAWSKGAISPKAHVLQYHNGVNLAGATLDLDRTLKPTFGAWAPSVSIPLLERKSTMIRVRVKDQAAVYVTNGNGRTWIDGALMTALEAAKVPYVIVDSQAYLDQLTNITPQTTGGVTQDMLNIAVAAALQNPAVLAALAPVIQNNSFLGAQRAEKE